MWMQKLCLQRDGRNEKAAFKEKEKWNKSKTASTRN